MVPQNSTNSIKPSSPSTRPDAFLNDNPHDLNDNSAAVNVDARLSNHNKLVDSTIAPSSTSTMPANSEHDDARDTMNLPASYVAPFHRPENLREILSGERLPSECEINRLKQRRAAIEASVEADLREHRHDVDSDTADTAEGYSGSNSSLAESRPFGPTLQELEQHAGAIPLASGIVTVDPDQLDRALSETETLPTAHSQRTSQTPRPPTDEKRISFSSEALTETPFTGALKQFKLSQAIDKSKASGKENVPAKSRRNASLPEELAAMVRDAHSGEQNEGPSYENSNHHTHVSNLNPGSLIIETDLEKAAGSSDSGASPSPSTSYSSRTYGSDLDVRLTTTQPPNTTTSKPPSRAKTYQLPIPGEAHGGKTFRLLTNASDLQIARYIRRYGEEIGADSFDVENAANIFLAAPSTYILKDEKQEPTAIRVIGMIPEAMFWVAVAPVAGYVDGMMASVRDALESLRI